MTQPLPPLPPIPEAAPSARSRGQTWLARRRTPLIISVTALAAIGAGVGVAFAAAGESSTTQGAASTSTTAPASGATSNPTAHSTARARKGIRATIVSESASTWTVRTNAGQSLVVTITPQTHFGTMKAPAMPAQFTPGESVVILGTPSNGTVTATRIAVAAPGAAKALPSSAPTTS